MLSQMSVYKITKPIKLMKSHISSGESGIMVDAVRYRCRETSFAMIHNWLNKNVRGKDSFM